MKTTPGKSDEEIATIIEALRVHADELIKPDGTNASLLRQNLRHAADLLSALREARQQESGSFSDETPDSTQSQPHEEIS